MKKTIFTRGFTLIELLVVIAIIGILASVVLASLNSARSKGADAAAASSLNNARAQAELYYSEQTPPGYRKDASNSVCNTPATSNGIQANLEAASNAIPGTGAANCVVKSDGSAWAAEIQLTDSTWYCVDSTGFGGKAGSDRVETGAPACDQAI